MQDHALFAAGAVTIAAALAHGILGETRVFARAQIAPARLRLLLRLVWQCGTLAWIGIGVLLAAAPLLASAPARAWIVGIAVAVLGPAVAANAWATRFRHFGWAVLALACILALAGL